MTTDMAVVLVTRNQGLIVNRTSSLTCSDFKKPDKISKQKSVTTSAYISFVLPCIDVWQLRWEGVEGNEYTCVCPFVSIILHWGCLNHAILAVVGSKMLLVRAGTWTKQRPKENTSFVELEYAMIISDFEAILQLRQLKRDRPTYQNVLPLSVLQALSISGLKKGIKDY